jgi:hypothetical protein
MQHAYSWLGSRIHLVLEEDVADAYNRHVEEFVNAQIRHEKLHGSKWTPDQPLMMNLSKKDFEVYDKLADILNQLIELNGGGLDIPEEECTSDGFVRLD